MREITFIDQVRKAAHQNRIWMPSDDITNMRTQRNWPLCMTCGREVDSTSLENVNAWSFEIRAKCHGAEDAIRVKFPFRIDGDVMADERANSFLKRAMGDFCPFDPTIPEK